MAPKYRFTPGTAQRLEGPLVKVGPSAPGRKDGFEGVLRDFEGEGDAKVATVWSLKKNRECWRTVAASRVTIRRKRRPPKGEPDGAD